MVCVWHLTMVLPVIILQSLDWEYFWPHFEKQDGRHRRFFAVMKSAYISLIIGPRGLGW